MRPRKLATSKRPIVSAVTVAFCLGLFEVAIVRAVSVDFDDSPAPCEFASTAALRGEFAAVGVTFSAPGNDGGAILDECGNFDVTGHSPPNFLAFNAEALLNDGGIPRDPETILFSPPYPTSVSFKVGSGADPGALSADAFDSDDVLVDSQALPMLAAALQSVALNASIGIAKVVVTGPGVFVIDDLEFTGPCAPSASSCKAAGKAILLLKNNADDSKDKLAFKWLKGSETMLSELGTPTGTTNYTLCLNAGTTTASVLLPGGSKWQASGTKGFKFKDPTGAPDGAQKAVLKSGAAGKAKALVKGKGSELPDSLIPALPLPVTARLVNDENSTCFEVVFDSGDVIKNDAKQFKAKAQ